MGDVESSNWKIWTGGELETVDNFSFECSECEGDTDCTLMNGCCNAGEGICECNDGLGDITCDVGLPYCDIFEWQDLGETSVCMCDVLESDEHVFVNGDTPSQESQEDVLSALPIGAFDPSTSSCIYTEDLCLETESPGEDVWTALVNPRTSFENLQNLLDLGGVVDVSFDRGDVDGPVDRRDQFHLFSEYLYSIVTSSATSVSVDPTDSLRQAERNDVDQSCLNFHCSVRQHFR